MAEAEGMDQAPQHNERNLLVDLYNRIDFQHGGNWCKPMMVGTLVMVAVAVVIAYSVGIDSMHPKVYNAENNWESCNNQLKECHTMEDSLNRKVDQLENRVLQSETERNRLGEQLPECQLEVNTLNDSVKDLRCQLRQAQSEVETTKEDLGELRQQLNEMEGQIHKLQVRLIQVESERDTESGERYNLSRKLEVLEVKNQGLQGQITSEKKRVEACISGQKELESVREELQSRLQTCKENLEKEKVHSVSDEDDLKYSWVVTPGFVIVVTLGLLAVCVCAISRKS